MMTDTISIEQQFINESNQIAALLERQRNFFSQVASKRWSNRKQAVKTAKKELKALKASIKAHEQEVIDALHADFRKGSFEAYVTEVALCYEEINLFRSYLRDWSDPEKVITPITNFKGSSYIYRVPRGNVLVIGPWNYPFYLTMVPIIGAIATGNTVLLKPSEYSPNTNAVMRKILGEVFQEEQVAIIEGEAEVTQEILKHKFDYIFFTGSTHVGRIVAEAAARHLTPVTLELGGKSPCIIDKSANIKVAAKRVAWGKLLNGGQSCVTPDYIIVHESIRDQFVAELRKVIDEFYGEDPKNSEDFARIINQRHFDRIVSLIDTDKVVYGGETDRETLYISPTIIDGITWEDPIMKEEVFGPVATIMTFNDIDEVIEKINRLPRALALYLFASDKKLENRIIHEINFGGGCINDTMVHLGNSHLPFGGTGDSGYGAYHGKSSFDTFTQQKSIIKKATWIDVALRYPPYKRNLRWMKKILN